MADTPLMILRFRGNGLPLHLFPQQLAHCGLPMVQITTV
ncbi:UNVERIFIED_ORG: hypothetical protein GGE63_000778 [Rhizobium esperanzae]